MATDAEIVHRSLKDPDAFVALFDRHHDALWTFLRGRVGPDLADDLAAQAFTEAFDRRATYDATYPDARPWLFGFALNLLRHHHRREARQWRAYAREAGRTVTVAGEDEPAERLTLRETGARAAHALATLPAHERDVLLLLAWGELDYEEIAQALHVPVGTVRSRLHRARRSMRARLELDADPEATPWTTST